jgi:hypothetical protein
LPEYEYLEPVKGRVSWLTLFEGCYEPPGSITVGTISIELTIINSNLQLFPLRKSKILYKSRLFSPGSQYFTEANCKGF